MSSCIAGFLKGNRSAQTHSKILQIRRHLGRQVAEFAQSPHALVDARRGIALFRYSGFPEALQVVVERRCIRVEVAVADHGDGEIGPLIETLAENSSSLFLILQEAETREQGGVA